jgi:hypothetical protein
MGRARDNRRHRDDGPRISRASLLTSHALVLMTIELGPPAAPVSDDVLSHAGGGRARACLDDVRLTQVTSRSIVFRSGERSREVQFVCVILQHIIKHGS